MIDFVPLQYYVPLYYTLMFTLCIITGVRYMSDNGCKKLLAQNSSFWAFAICVVLTLYIGLRPISGRYFCDMYMYAHAYRAGAYEAADSLFDFHKEWFFALVMKLCKNIFGNVNIWFLVIDIFYFGCQIWACKKLLKENVWMSILFVFFSYQFMAFGTNGLRNGMACALMTLALAYFCDRNTKGYIVGIFLSLLAMGCHRSVMIPIAAFVVSFVIRDTKKVIIIWVLCILASLVSGNFFQNLFASIGFDDRMSNYSNSSEGQFSHTGFRWDFLLYSSMPVLLSWYMAKNNKIDRTFSTLANTYIIANSFWVLVCRMPFSNRIAYLSWFIYALVLAYGVIRVPIWKDQDKMAGRILILHAAFTFVMFLIGK